MRGVRRSARGESSRKAAAAADREVERFTLCPKMSHLTRATSEPCRRARGAAPARRTRPFSAFELVSAREAGRAGGAGFSAADRAYLGRQHIPTKGPWGVDEVDSEAYVSQFSADGSLLIAGFRVGGWLWSLLVLVLPLMKSCVVADDSVCKNVIVREAASESTTPRKGGRFIRI